MRSKTRGNGAGGKARLRLCPYHEDGLGWDACTEGFVGCRVEDARRAHYRESGDCRDGRHAVAIGHGQSLLMCGKCKRQHERST